MLRSRYLRQITGKVVEFKDDGNCFFTKDEAEKANKDIAKRVEAAKAARVARAVKGKQTKVNPDKSEKKGKGKKKGKRKK